MQFRLPSKAFNYIFETHKRANGWFQLTCMSIAKPVILVCQLKIRQKQGILHPVKFASFQCSGGTHCAIVQVAKSIPVHKGAY